MRSIRLVLCLPLCLVLLTIAAPLAVGGDGCCSTGGCATCKPKWEDKKTKKPTYSMKCSEECVRGFDAWCDHGCCAEDTPPCAGIFTRKKLFKQEEDKTQRVLKYDLVQAPAAPCTLPPCGDCEPAWYDLRGLLCRCLGL